MFGRNPVPIDLIDRSCSLPGIARGAHDVGGADDAHGVDDGDGADGTHRPLVVTAADGHMDLVDRNRHFVPGMAVFEGSMGLSNSNRLRSFVGRCTEDADSNRRFEFPSVVTTVVIHHKFATYADDGSALTVQN